MTITETATWTGVHITRDEAIACAAGLSLLASQPSADISEGVGVDEIDVHRIGSSAYCLLWGLGEKGTWISDDIDSADQMPTTEVMACLLGAAAELLASFDNDVQSEVVADVVDRLHNWIDSDDDQAGNDMPTPMGVAVAHGMRFAVEVLAGGKGVDHADAAAARLVENGDLAEGWQPADLAALTEAMTAAADDNADRDVLTKTECSQIEKLAMAALAVTGGEIGADGKPVMLADPEWGKAIFSLLPAIWAAQDHEHELAVWLDEMTELDARGKLDADLVAKLDALPIDWRNG